MISTTPPWYEHRKDPIASFKNYKCVYFMKLKSKLIMYIRDLLHSPYIIRQLYLEQTDTIILCWIKNAA